MLEPGVARESTDGAWSCYLHRIQDELRTVEPRPLFQVKAQPASHRKRERQVGVGLFWDGAWA